MTPMAKINVPSNQLQIQILGRKSWLIYCIPNAYGQLFNQRTQHFRTRISIVKRTFRTTRSVLTKQSQHRVKGQINLDRTQLAFWLILCKMLHYYSQLWYLLKNKDVKYTCAFICPLFRTYSLMENNIRKEVFFFYCSIWYSFGFGHDIYLSRYLLSPV